MMSIIIGIIGVTSIVIFLIFSEQYSFSTQEQTITSLLLLISTLLIEVLASIIHFYKKIQKIHPFISLSNKEQYEGFMILNILKKLNKKEVSNGAILAIHQFNQAKNALTNSLNNQDFHVSNIVETNKILLNSLKKGDTFDGVSMLIEADLWKHDGYLDINIAQAKKGVKIRRIFVFDNLEQYESMKEIMNTLSHSKTKVYWCTKEKLNFQNFYQDFTIIKEHNVGIFIPIQEINPTMIVSSSDEQIKSLQIQFSKLLEYSIEYKK